MSADVLAPIRAAEQRLIDAAYRLAAARMIKAELEEWKRDLRKAAMDYAREAAKPFRAVDREAREG